MSDAVKRYSFDDPELSGIRRAFVLATAYDAQMAENVRLLAELDEVSPLINCARCAKPDRMHRMCLEEGDEWECVECNDRCNAQEKAALAALNDKGDGT